MTKLTTNRTSNRPSRAFFTDTPTPGILVAFAPEGSAAVDRCRLSVPFAVGRGRDASLSIRDDKVSKRHFEITHGHGSYWIEDLGSTNGTFVDGLRVGKRTILASGAVIRAGRAVLVFHEDAGPMLGPPRTERYGMAGKFHTIPLLEDLADAARSDRQILLAGPTGTGKELASRALADIMSRGKEPVPLLVQNSAQHSSEEEAMTTIFGVGDGVFTGVRARPGLIERADGGALFLDEIHTLPTRVQQGLLRIVEDGRFSRFGEIKERSAKVKFIFACNQPGPDYSLPRDFVARLRVVEIPPLAERTADIPSIFDAALSTALEKKKLKPEPVLPLIRADHYESMCLDGFEADNARGLMDLADRIATRISSGGDPKEAIMRVFTEHFKEGVVRIRQEGTAPETDESHHYEKHKTQIVQAYDETGGNLSATERLLRSRGIMCTRRWLGIHLKRWGVRG